MEIRIRAVADTDTDTDMGVTIDMHDYPTLDGGEVPVVRMILRMKEVTRTV
jgi:hypothetical protein